MVWRCAPSDALQASGVVMVVAVVSAIIPISTPATVMVALADCAHVALTLAPITGVADKMADTSDYEYCNYVKRYAVRSMTLCTHMCVMDFGQTILR